MVKGKGGDEGADKKQRTENGACLILILNEDKRMNIIIFSSK